MDTNQFTQDVYEYCISRQKYLLFGTLCMLDNVNMYRINKIIALNNFLNTVLYSILFETKHSYLALNAIQINLRW